VTCVRLASRDTQRYANLGIRVNDAVARVASHPVTLYMSQFLSVSSE
jgi:hypothetical protein